MAEPKLTKEQKSQQELDNDIKAVKDLEKKKESKEKFSFERPAEGISKDILQNSIMPVGVPTVGTSVKLGKNFILSGALKSSATVTSVANTTTETDLNSYTFEANELHKGITLRVKGAGVYTTDDAANTVAIELKMGDTTYHTITTTAATVTNVPWCVDWLVIISAIGSSGTAESYASAKTNNVNKDSGATSTTAIDTSAQQKLSLTATWNTADADDTLSIRQFLVEVLT